VNFDYNVSRIYFIWHREIIIFKNSLSKGIDRTCLRDIVIEPGQSLRLDLVRCLLLAQVVLGHLGLIVLAPIPELWHQGGTLAWIGIPFRLVTRFGPQAASLFVFMSGFFVGGSLIKDNIIDEHRSDALGFVRKRLLRIVPSLALALVLTAVLDGIAIYGLGLGSTYAAYPDYDMTAFLTLWNFVGNLLCLEPTVVGVFGSNGPLWTLGYIVQFYVAGFLLFRYGVGSSWLRTLVMGCALAFMAITRPEWFILFIVWLAGAFSRYVRSPHVHGWLALGGAILIVILANRMPTLISEAAAVGSGMLLIWWVRCSDFVFSGWNRLVVRSLAAASYSIYAVHFPIAFFVFAVAFGSPSDSIANFFVFLVGTLSAIWIIALMVQYASYQAVNRFSGFLASSLR
jgi:peptidoglycan/LPS O-acetylase OafA/YrhL